MDQAIPQADRRGAMSDGAALSPRELEVARHTAEGKTNRQIAADLSITEKTVETHLSHVFSKLGISSRRSVAAKLWEGNGSADTQTAS